MKRPTQEQLPAREHLRLAACELEGNACTTECKGTPEHARNEALRNVAAWLFELIGEPHEATWPRVQQDD